MVEYVSKNKNRTSQMLTTFFTLTCVFLIGTEDRLFAATKGSSHPNVVASLSKEAYCLAANIYFEARGESQRGQIAVGMVTMNRYQSGRFAKSVCGVVWDRGQFSWTFDQYSDTPRPGPIWTNIVRIAKRVIAGEWYHRDPTGTASHYHANYVHPFWASKFKLTAQIGNHLFYRMPGFSVHRNSSNRMDVSMNVNVVGELYDVSLDPSLEAAEEPLLESELENFNQFMMGIETLPQVEEDSLPVIPPNPLITPSSSDLPPTISL